MRGLKALFVAALSTAVGSCAPSSVLRPTGGDAPTGWDLAEDWPRLPAGRELGRVLGVTIDAKDRVWISHTGGGSSPRPEILALDPVTGNVVAEIDASRFASPHALAFDDAGQLWVTDDAQDRIVVLDATGREVLVLGGSP